MRSSSLFARREASFLMAHFLSLCASKTSTGWDCRGSVSLELSPDCSIFQSPRHQDTCIVELGSGTGLLGLHLASLLSSSDSLPPLGSDERKPKLILTDLPDVCPMTEDTIHRACTTKDAGFPRVDIHVHPLPWGDVIMANELALLLEEGSSSRRHITHIICSDLVSFPSSFANESLNTYPRTIIGLLPSSPSPSPTNPTPAHIHATCLR